MSAMDRFKNVSGWIINSGIQSPEGAFYSWFDLDAKKHSYVYSEITGYGITTLLFLYKETTEPVYLDRAQGAGNWLINSAMHPCGGVRTRLYKEGVPADSAYSFAAENIFSFDTGMALFGMVNLYRIVQQEKYLLAACKMADFLIDVMQAQDGSLRPIYNAKTKATIHNTEKWSNQSSSFHVKAAMGLVDLYQLTQDVKYKNAALRLADFALSFQTPEGRFITDSATHTTHMHPHCYSAEGLLYVGSHLGDPRFIIASRRATEWALSKVETGGIHELYNPNTDSFNAFIRSDVLAQLLRLSLVFSKSAQTRAPGGDTPDSQVSGSELLYQALCSHQYKGSSVQEGGFFFSASAKHVNSWCSMFALQAVYWYAHKDNADYFVQPNLLI